MPAFVTDDSPKQIAIDLSTTGALAIRTGIRCRLLKARVSGSLAANKNGSIVLRADNVSGPIVWNLEANVTTATRFVTSEDFNSGGAPNGRASSVVSGLGLFLDALTDAWTAGSLLILYLDSLKSFGNFGE